MNWRPGPVSSRSFRFAALVVALFVALREAIYYLDHPGRSGPALMIVLLAVAVTLLAIASLGKSQA